MVFIEYISPIDGHVHLRWNEYADVQPSFAELAMRDAKAVGLIGIVEEPNTDPYLTDEKSVSDRIKFIDEIRKKTNTEDIAHGIAIAITADKDQILGALELIANNPRVVSGKTFFAKSTKSGGIEILEHDKQRLSWQILGKSPKGAILREGHYEDDDLFVLPFNPQDPITHSLKQGPETEVVQFERQFQFAYDAGFSGILLVKHTTNPETILLGEKLIRQFQPKFKVMYETTPHHMFLNAEEDYRLHGNLVKMNPPLRSKRMQEELLNLVIQGRTHIIGTDHAPHKYEQKIGLPYKSGIPVILFYPKAIELLRESGLRASDELRLFFETGNKIYFGSKLRPRQVTIEYNPDLWGAYGWNPFSRIDGSK